LQFGSDVPEREANAGQIAYQKYTDALDISGAGNDINSRKIYFHAEGGSFLSCGGTGMLFEIGHNTEGSSAWIGTTTTHGLFIGTNSVGSIYLDSKQHVFVSSSSRMPVVSSKNLEKYDLFVTRGILSEDYALAPVSAWADYVFKSEYHLSPLNDVEKFIKTNNHLPGIPSQQQISTEGYSLKDMNVKFLVKIEERYSLCHSAAKNYK
jgi:hypothetical protein